MPRIRTIKPEFWSDEKLAPLTPIDRLVFLGLISIADDCGRHLDNLKQIDAALFPETDDSARDSLNVLASMGRIRRGETASGQRVIQIVNWSRHQKVDRPNLGGSLPAIAGDEDEREHYHTQKRIPEAVRREVFARAASTCARCRRSGLVPDRSADGPKGEVVRCDGAPAGAHDDAEALVLLCVSCNRRRGAATRFGAPEQLQGSVTAQLHETDSQLPHRSMSLPDRRPTTNELRSTSNEQRLQSREADHSSSTVTALSDHAEHVPASREADSCTTSEPDPPSTAAPVFPWIAEALARRESKRTSVPESPVPQTAHAAAPASLTTALKTAGRGSGKGPALDAAREAFARKVGIIDPARFAKLFSPALDVYTGEQIVAAVEAFAEVRDAVSERERGFMGVQRFADTLAEWVRLGAMPLTDANGTPTERGRRGVFNWTGSK